MLRPPFFSADKNMISPLFQQKVYDWPHFSELVYERPHFSDVSRYMHICFEAACSLSIQWIDWYICLTTSNKWVQKKSKGSIWMGQHFRRFSIWMGPFLQRPGIWLGWVSKYWLEHPYYKYPQVTPQIQEVIKNDQKKNAKRTGASLLL